MSSDVSEETLRVRKRTAALWIALAAIVAAIIVVVIVIASTPPTSDGADKPATPQATDSPEPEPEPTVTEKPADAGEPTAPGKIADADATMILETALAVPISDVGTQEDLAERLKSIASDGYAEELEAQWLELSSQGWTISGSPTVVSAEVTSLNSDTTPPTATVNACVDSSAVSILDADGKPIGDASATTPRALHIFTLTQGEDNAWRISGHTFPNDPTC